MVTCGIVDGVMVVCLSGCMFFEIFDVVGGAAVNGVSAIGCSEGGVAGKVGDVEDDVDAVAVVVGRFEVGIIS